MLPEQQQVVEEKAELDEKLRKLTEFRYSKAFTTLPSDEQARLIRKHACMVEYSAVLGECIKAFPKPEPVQTVRERELTSHRLTGPKMDGLNDQLLVQVLDQPGQGNACHEYRIVRWIVGTGDDVELCNIKFQDGPIVEVGVNGVSNEALLSIVEDRLVGFQSGPFACDENAAALGHVRAALMQLLGRTRGRIARGVEGTNQL